MSSKTYQCYKFTKDDKEWRKAGGKISKKFIRSEDDMCTRHEGKSYTRGNNRQYPGCGNCWCCQVILEPNIDTTPTNPPLIDLPNTDTNLEEDSDEEIEVDIWIHCNDEYLIFPKTLEVYSEDGEVIGIWGEGNYQGFPIPDEALKGISPEVLRNYHNINSKVQSQEEPIINIDKITQVEEPIIPKITTSEKGSSNKSFESLLQLSLENLCMDLSSQKKYSPNEIIQRRTFVYDEIKEFLGITDEELTNTLSGLNRLFELFNRDNRAFFHKLLELYDEAFFQNKLRELCCEQNCKFNICWNNRCTSTGGICKYKPHLYTRKDSKTGKQVKIKSQVASIEIHLAPKVFTKGLLNLPDSDHLKTGGLTCDNFLNCMLLIFEHELVHALIACFCVGEGDVKHSREATWKGNTGGGGHGIIFMSIVNNLFGQTEFTHELLKNIHTIPPEIMVNYVHRDETILKKTLQRGEEVYFGKKGVMTRAFVEESKGGRKKTLLVGTTDGKYWKVYYKDIYHRK